MSSAPGDGRTPRPPSGNLLPYVQAPAGEQPVELRGLEIRVVVSGLFAETTQTLRLYNPNGRELEGSLVFPLPDGATVCGYALDVQGQLVDGVVVTKKEARRILEAEERKGVDPGLVEQVRGNLYRVRVYPIPARGTRTVRLTYVSELSVQGGDAAHHLPLAHANSIERVELQVEVVRAPVQPVLTGGLGNLSLARWEDRWVAKATFGAGAPADDLLVRLPSLPDHFCTVERCGEEVFFCVSAKVPSSDSRTPKAAGSAPRRLALAWDGSGSRQSLATELQLLQDLLARWQHPVVDLVVFRGSGDLETATFGVAGSGADGTQALVEHLEALPYDGATDLAGLDLAAVPHADDEAWLLFSDGLGTVRPGLPARGGLPVHTVTAQASSHGALLRRVAEQSGGVHVNLLRMTASAALEALAAPLPRLRATDTQGCSDVHLVQAGGRISVLGRLVGSEGRVELGLGSSSELVHRCELGVAQASEGRILARAWAGRQVEVVQLTEGEEAVGLLTLGRRYGLVTPGTSLLVLETLEQHLEHGVEPPASRPAMLAAYRASGAVKQQAKEAKRGSHIEATVRLWKQRVEWWETDFSPRPVDLLEEKRDAGSPRAAMGMTAGAMPPPASAPAPGPPPSPPPMVERERADEWAEGEEDAEEEMEDLCMACEDAPEPAPARRSRAKKKAGKGGPRPASISIQPWSPTTPYLAAMRAVATEQAYAAYLTQRPAYAASPSFFLDCGDYLLRQERAVEGLRVLSNLLELSLDDPPLLRMYAWRLQQAGELDLAVTVLERVLTLRPDEPQSHRDLGLALGARWDRDGAASDAARALELLYEVVLREWDRFPEIELIALMELNRLLHRAQAAGVTIPATIDPRLRKLLDLDVRISMSWDADMTDVDLHVYEPTGEHAYYGHNRTAMGGLVSRDFTQGYGPEEYVLRRARPGQYTVKARYYGSSQQTLCGPCTVVVHVFTDYGRPHEQHQVLTLRLDQPADEVQVGIVSIGAGPAGTDAPGHAWKARFAALRRGMTLAEITAAVGQPAEITGADVTMLRYRPAPGVLVQVLAAPRLVAVQQVMEGALLDLI